jgi:hypothetical protein
MRIAATTSGCVIAEMTAALPPQCVPAMRARENVFLEHRHHQADKSNWSHFRAGRPYSPQEIRDVDQCGMPVVLESRRDAHGPGRLPTDERSVPSGKRNGLPLGSLDKDQEGSAAQRR